MKAFLLLSFLGEVAMAKPDPRITESAGRILSTRCGGCHGKRNPERGINVLERRILIKEGVLQPFSDDSALLQVIESGRMPLHAPQLSAQEAGMIRQWILQGAQQFKRR